MSTSGSPRSAGPWRVAGTIGRMTERPQRPTVDLSRRRLVSVALLTIVGITLFVVALLTTEPNWMMWFFGILMLLSALAFWTTYGIYLHKRRNAGR